MRNKIFPLSCIFIVLLMASATTTYAASGKAIDIKVDAAVERFYADVDGAKEFADAAEGMLIFPSVIKAGIGIGGEYGEGALRIGGETVAYYSTAAASIGFQLGVPRQKRFSWFSWRRKHWRIFKAAPAGKSASMAR